MRKPAPQQMFNSTCNGETMRGTPAQLAEKYEDKAKLAERAKDHVLMHTYLQHAEYWRRGV